MRIGLAGTGRIGAFHAKTLTTLDGVDDLVLADLDAALARTGRDRPGGQRRPEHRRAARLGPRRLRHHRGHRRARRAARGGHRPRHPDVLREAGRARPRAHHRPHRARGTQLGAGAHRLPAALRHRLPPGARRGRVGRAGLHPHRARRDDGPGPAARGLPAHLGWPVPRLQRARLRHPPVRHRAARSSRVFAVGANKGEPFFTEAGDVDTAAATLVLDDGTLVSVTATRYNGAGHDVRMEVHGSTGHPGRRARHHLGHHLGRARHRVASRARGTGRSWSASCRPTSPSSPPSSTWPAATPRARARSRTPSRRSAPPRPAPAR